MPLRTLRIHMRKQNFLWITAFVPQKSTAKQFKKSLLKKLSRGRGKQIDMSHSDGFRHKDRCGARGACPSTVKRKCKDLPGSKSLMAISRWCFQKLLRLLELDVFVLHQFRSGACISVLVEER